MQAQICIAMPEAGPVARSPRAVAAAPGIGMRRARPGEADMLRHMHLSWLVADRLGAFSLAQIGRLLCLFPTVDPAAMGQGGYFVAELDGEIAGAGGWVPAEDSLRLQGNGPADQPILLPVPPRSAAVRALFAGDMAGDAAERLLAEAEVDATFAGRSSMEALAGEAEAALYRAAGYREMQSFDFRPGRGVAMRLVHFRKALHPRRPGRHARRGVHWRIMRMLERVAPAMRVGIAG